MTNPFHPTFGVSPPLLVGRDDVLAEFGQALDDGPGSSGRATLYTGARGAGKTVVLTLYTALPTRGAGSAHSSTNPR